jgi:hypothetical protein
MPTPSRRCQPPFDLSVDSNRLSVEVVDAMGHPLPRLGERQRKPRIRVAAERARERHDTVAEQAAGKVARLLCGGGLPAIA